MAMSGKLLDRINKGAGSLMTKPTATPKEGGFRATSARGMNCNAMSYDCSLKRHKACPKASASWCGCVCHGPREISFNGPKETV